MPLQINLVNESFRPRRSGLNHRVIIIAAAAAWLLLHVVGRSVATSVETLTQRVAAADAKITGLKADVEKSTEAARRREPDKGLIEEIARLELRLELQRDTLIALDTGGLGNSIGFSNYLAAFARRATDGVWLTRIAVDSAANEVQLRGRVLRAELLPGYLRALGEEAALRDKRFGELTVTTKSITDESAAATQPSADADRPADAVAMARALLGGAPTAASGGAVPVASSAATAASGAAAAARAAQAAPAAKPSAAASPVTVLEFALGAPKSAGEGRR